jgi:UDP-N-acetylglucosamine 2-epimerase (non-hydrolysing)
VKIAIVLGTRPEIIKFSPVIRLFERAGVDYYVLHTGQHYSYNMDRVFFEQLELPDVKYNLDVGSGSHGWQTGRMLEGIEDVLVRDRPDVVLVEGDTNSVLAGAVAAVKLHVRVGHVEAGLRSYDRRMPEEINRVLTDHCSDLLFAPTPKAAGILSGEGIPEGKVFMVGNTIVDAVQQNLELARSKSDALRSVGVEEGVFMLATVHRQENVDDPARFSGIVNGLLKVQQEFGVPVVYPVHPRARKRLGEYGLDASGLRLVEPLDYLGFLRLESCARLVLTDSGGVQEEACVLGVPCVTLRDNTERPETLDVGSNVLAGTDANVIVECAGKMVGKRGGWVNPFGAGDSAVRILKVLRERFE